MNKEFIPYEQSLELIALGFDEVCLAITNVNSYELKIIYENYNKELYLPTPLYQQAFRWFRERYLLHHEIACGDNVFWFRYGKNGYVAVLSIDTNNDSYWSTYEEAELACLKKLIEIVKNK